MSDKLKLELLEGEEVFNSSQLELAGLVGKSQPPLEAFFAAYRRAILRCPEPGDHFFLARQLIMLFGAERAFVLWQLGRADEYATWGWGITLFERTPPVLEKMEEEFPINRKLFRRAERERRDWAIYNRIVAMIENGATLGDAYDALAGTAYLGRDSIEKIWKTKNAIVLKTGQRLVPQFGLGGRVLPPGQQPKRGRRVKAPKGAG